MKYRHFKDTCVNSAQVAECVSKFTEEVSLGRDLAWQASILHISATSFNMLAFMILDRIG